MSLDGAQIQDLLWEAGLDFEYSQTQDGYGSMDINVGDRKIRVEKLWSADESEEWVLDPGDIDLSLVDIGGLTWIISSESESESDLIHEILKIIEDMG